jgi:hypothetical protein
MRGNQRWGKGDSFQTQRSRDLRLRELFSGHRATYLTASAAFAQRRVMKMKTFKFRKTPLYRIFGLVTLAIPILTATPSSAQLQLAKLVPVKAAPPVPAIPVTVTNTPLPVTISSPVTVANPLTLSGPITVGNPPQPGPSERCGQSSQ